MGFLAHLFALGMAGLLPATTGAAELETRTIEAYERYIAALAHRFASGLDDDRWIEQEQMRARLHAGEIIAAPGHGDGIIDGPGGLIHHWRAVAFIPDVTLEAVTSVARKYADYPRTYEWVIGSRPLAHERAPDDGHDRYWVVLRIERSAGPVSSVVDLWAFVEYRYLDARRVTAVSDADCIREVKDAGEPGERRLPLGTGAGHLWRANTFSTYHERDGGVYVELETVGLSRGFPPLLGWIIEPIARRLGRGSAAESVRQLREAVLDRQGASRVDDQTDPVRMPAFWCAPDMTPPHHGRETLARDPDRDF